MSLKILDFGKPDDPFGDTIGKARYLAWPVNAYRVTLPQSANDGDGLNAFERVILKFLDAVGAMEANTLADETRIPLDLVECILLRLRDKGFIDEYNAIIRRKRGNLEGQEEQLPVFVTAILFRELATGRILPFLHLLDDKNPLRKKEGEDNFVRPIRWNDAHKKTLPAPRDVISALRTMKRRSTVFGRDDKTPAVQQIIIAPLPESYYLECPIAIQKSDGEFRIADPFGNGFSLVLERSFEQMLEEDDKLADWLSDWKQSLSNSRHPKAGDLKEQSREPFDNEANRQRYSKLVANMRPSRITSFRSIAKIHASIEWALFYACSRRPFEDAITTLTFSGQLEHSALLENAAQSVGLALPEFGLRPIPEGKLIDFKNGKAELETVLAIAILQAEKDDSHPLRSIAPSDPDLISHLLDIKKKRDAKGHGKGGIDAPDAELASDPLMRRIVHAFLPDICFADTPVAELDKDARGDSLLDARTSIQGEFGFKLFNRLGANLQDRLVYAERFWLSCKDNDDALSFACDLYAAVQSAFEKKLTGILPPDISDSEFITMAERNAAKAGLCTSLPKCLCTVKKLAIRQTLLGTRQTLGSCVVAFLIMSDNHTLNSVANLQSSFMDDIENVINKRGHGNEPQLLSKINIAKLRKASFSIIKTLMEA